MQIDQTQSQDQSQDQSQGHNQRESSSYGSLLSGLGSFLGFIGTCIPCCGMIYPYRTVDSGYKGVIKYFGKIENIVEPGLYHINPLSQKMDLVDIKLKIIDLNRQTVITKDNVTMNIDAVVYYKIVNVEKAIYTVSDIHSAVTELSCATLRDVTGHKTLQEILEKRDELTELIQKIVSEKTDTWGIRIEGIKLKDIIMSAELQETMASAAKASRQAESKIITAKAEVDAAKLMRQASDILDSNAAMQIRWLETMRSLASSSNAKVIFMPTEHKEMVKNTLVSQQYNEEIIGMH